MVTTNDDNSHALSAEADKINFTHKTIKKKHTSQKKMSVTAAL